jgi:UDP-glucose 4-epimerase
MAGSVLVSGGAGFIGSSLVRMLLETGYHVTVLDNFVNGKRDSLPEHHELEVVEGDVTSSEDVERCLEPVPDYVVHLAAYHFIPFCDSHPAETIRVNTYGTQNLLEVISNRENSPQKIICASTAAVYLPSETACKEDGRTGPIDIYGISKLAGEQIADLFQRRTGIPCLNIRIFNAIGPRETNPHLLPDIISQMQEGRLEIRLGNLTPKRDYIYVDDISGGVLTLLESDTSSGTFNVGSGHAYNAEEILEIITYVTGREYSALSVKSMQRKGDRPCLLADNTKLASLGWKCKHSTTEAIAKTLAFYGVA